MQKKIIITGSSGLVGSEAVRFFNDLDWQVVGLDCNARAEFFGEEGSTNWNLENLKDTCKNFIPLNVDIRDKTAVFDAFYKWKKADLICHFAAQPAHDYSWNNPLGDFYVNAVGTMHVLEAVRQYSPEAVFLYTSSSKVYGTAVNEYNFKELDTRYDYLSTHCKGIDENCRIDQNMTHSLFGASKLAADIMVGEYGAYFGLRTIILRPCCMTGSGHAGVELHGFLSYLIKCVYEGKNYNVFDDLAGKRVRDNIHSYDLVTACYEIFKNPPKPGTVFNIGGGRQNSISIIEALALARVITDKEPIYTITNRPRVGDHIVYITDMTKFETAYPNWKQTYNLTKIFEDIVDGYRQRNQSK